MQLESPDATQTLLKKKLMRFQPKKKTWSDWCLSQTHQCRYSKVLPSRDSSRTHWPNLTQCCQSAPLPLISMSASSLATCCLEYASPTGTSRMTNKSTNTGLRLSKWRCSSTRHGRKTMRTMSRRNLSTACTDYGR